MPAAIPIIGAVATVAGAAMQGRASDRASRSQQQSAAQELALQRDIFNSQQQMYSPYRQVGYGALNLLSNLYGLTPRQGGAPAALSAPGDSGAIARNAYSRLFAGSGSAREMRPPTMAA